MPIKSNKAQVWISVVIYTLIGITAIGLLLVALQPKINEARDSITIKQTVEALHNFDSGLRSTLIAPGNKRQIEFKLTEGELRVVPNDDKIIWAMKSSTPYSEPGVSGIREGSIEIFTEESDPFEVILTLNYAGIADIRFDKRTGNDGTAERILPKAGKAYSISVENQGGDPGQTQIVNLKLRG